MSQYIWLSTLRIYTSTYTTRYIRSLVELFVPADPSRILTTTYLKQVMLFPESFRAPLAISSIVKEKCRRQAHS
jgi:hypothetical protein